MHGDTQVHRQRYHTDPDDSAYWSPPNDSDGPREWGGRRAEWKVNGRPKDPSLEFQPVDHRDGPYATKSEHLQVTGGPECTEPGFPECLMEPKSSKSGEITSEKQMRRCLLSIPHTCEVDIQGRYQFTQDWKNQVAFQNFHICLRFPQPGNLVEVKDCTYSKLKGTDMWVMGRLSPKDEAKFVDFSHANCAYKEHEKIFYRDPPPPDPVVDRDFEYIGPQYYCKHFLEQSDVRFTHDCQNVDLAHAHLLRDSSYWSPELYWTGRPDSVYQKFGQLGNVEVPMSITPNFMTLHTYDYRFELILDVEKLRLDREKEMFNLWMLTDVKSAFGIMRFHSMDLDFTCKSKGFKDHSLTKIKDTPDNSHFLKDILTKAFIPTPGIQISHTHKSY